LFFEQQRGRGDVAAETLMTDSITNYMAVLQ